MTYCIDLRKRVINSILRFKFSIQLVSKIFNVNRSTIYRWINLHKNNNLYIKTSRKLKINQSIKEYIKNYVIKRTNFSYIRLIKIIQKKYNTSIAKSTIYNILKELNITKKKIYIKPFYSSIKKHNEKLRVFKDKIKKIDSNKIISIDETSVDTHIDHNYGWSIKGKKIVRKKTKQKIRYTIICGITNKKIIHYNIIKGSANGENMITFIKELDKKIRFKYYLLMDNARIHHYNKLKEYIKTTNKFECIYNLPYCPEYNPIEYLFNEFKYNLKKCIIKNKTIKKYIHKCMRIKNYHFKKYFKKSLSI